MQLTLYGKPGEIYNIASDNEMSVMKLTKLMIKTITGTENYDNYISFVTDRPFNDSRYYITSKKLKSLGWKQHKTYDDLIQFIKS